MGKLDELSRAVLPDGLVYTGDPSYNRSDESSWTVAADLVSVVVPTHNRSDQLRRAVDSVLQQSHKELEIIIVDDGSNPPADVEQRDRRIRLIRTDVCNGAAAARNAGIQAARGEYICFLDDDDCYLPGKLSKQLDYLRRHPTVDMVFSNVMCDHGKGRRRPWLGPDYGYNEIDNLCQNRIHTNSTLLRRHVVNRINFAEALCYGEDAEFYGRISLDFKVEYLPGIVAIWHRDNRPDRLTLQDLTLKYRSYKMFVETFEKVVYDHKVVRTHHYARLAYMALRLGNVAECRRFLSKLGIVNGVVQVTKYYISMKRQYIAMKRQL